MSTQTKFFTDVERLRGFACILVLIQHIVWICPMNFIYEIVPSGLIIGSGAVHIFFAISGFVVTLSLKDKLSSLSENIFLGRVFASKKFLFSFYKKRFFRIFPVLLFVMILIGVFLWLTEKDFAWLPSLIRAPLEVLFGVYNCSVELFVSKEKIHISGFGPFWTLAVEAQFYLLWPIVLLLCKDNNSRAITSLTLGCLFLFIIQPLSIVFFDYKYYLIHNNVSELFLGSFLAFLYNGDSWIKVNKKITLFISAILAMTIWFYPASLSKSFFSNIVITVSSVSIVALAVFSEGSFDIPILNKIFYFLGNRSYSFYAVQLSLANIVVWFTNSVYFPKESFSEYEFSFYQFIMFLIILFVVSDLVYRFIERPAREFGRR